MKQAAFFYEILQTIRFNEKFLPKIQSGEKCTTMRIKPFLPGEYYFNFGKGLIFKGKILRFKFKLFKELSLENAKSDGFDTLAELKDFLLLCYPKLQPDDFVFILYIE